MKKTLPTMMLLLSTACGDTYNQTYVVGGDTQKSQEVVNIKTCQDVANRLYQCNPQYFENYKSKWGQSIEQQKKDIVYECSSEKVDYFKNAPSWVSCISENTCDFINGGKVDWKGDTCDYLACGCGQYMPEH